MSTLENLPCKNCLEPMRGIRDYSARAYCIEPDCQRAYEEEQAWKEVEQMVKDGDDSKS